MLRYGFTIVPDFGGTAHSYCGSTLDACIGDLLSWIKKPTHSDMLRAYVINSRITDASKLALVQPYSPALFSQGTLPGPDLLLKVSYPKHRSNITEGAALSTPEEDCGASCAQVS